MEKNEILSSAVTWRDLEGTMLKWSQPDRGKQTLHMELKKYSKLENITKERQTQRHRKQTRSYQRGEGMAEGQYWVRGLSGTNYYHYCCCCCWAASVVPDSVQPHRRQPTRLPRPWDSPGKNTGVGCHFLLQCMKVKVKSLSRVWLLATPWTAAHQAPPPMGFSRQEYWSGVPLPSPNIPIFMDNL